MKKSTSVKLWVLIFIGFALPAPAHIFQKSYVETTKRGIQKLYVRIKESPKHPGYFNFQLCQFKYVDADQTELDLDRPCNDVSQGEMAISAFPDQPGQPAQAHQHYFKISSMVPAGAVGANPGPLGVDDRRSGMEDFATLMAAFSLGEFAAIKLGVKSLILRLGIDFAAFVVVDEMKARWAVNGPLGAKASADNRAAWNQPSLRKWDGYFGSHYAPTAELTKPWILMGKNEQGYASPYNLGACTGDDMDDKMASPRFAGDCTTIQEAALIIEIALQELAYHRTIITYMNSPMGGVPSTPLDSFDGSLRPWNEDFVPVTIPGIDDYANKTEPNYVRVKDPNRYFSYVHPAIETPGSEIFERIVRWWNGLWND